MESQTFALTLNTAVLRRQIEMLQGIIKRTKEKEEWLQRLPVASRIYYPEQIELHEDRKKLLELILESFEVK